MGGVRQVIQAAPGTGLLQAGALVRAGGDGEATGAEGGGAADVLCGVSNDDDLIDRERAVQAGFKAADGDRAEVVAVIGVVAKSAVGEGFVELEAAELEGGAVADVASEEAEGEVLGASLEGFDEQAGAGQEETGKTGGMQAGVQMAEVGGDEALAQVGVIRKVEVLKQAAHDAAIGGAGEIERGHGGAVDLKDLGTGVHEGVAPGPAGVEQGAVDVKEEEAHGEGE